MIQVGGSDLTLYSAESCALGHDELAKPTFVNFFVNELSRYLSESDISNYSNNI